jgi:hypothetical protein
VDELSRCKLTDERIKEKGERGFIDSEQPQRQLPDEGKEKHPSVGVEGCFQCKFLKLGTDILVITIYN